MNKQKNIIFLWQILIVIIMIIVGLILYSQLPDMMPTHWNVHNQPDKFSPKLIAILMLPTITLGVSILFRFLPNIDPKKDKYEQFAKTWHIFQIVFVIFFAYLYFVTLYGSFHSSINIGSFVLGGIGVLFVLLGNYMSKIRQNYFVGIKTPWTLNNEKIWNKTHRFGAWCFVIAGLAFLLSAITQQYLLTVAIVAILVSTLLPILYSYIIFKQEIKK